MEHIDFHISYTCFNSCVFCSSADSIERFEAHPLKMDDIIGMLQKKRKQGFASVNFTGGEPTLVSFFPLLAKQAKGLGFRVSVGTNGGRFEDKEFCLAAAPFLDEVCFSCHGHTPRLHNLLTADSRAFRRLRRAMDNLSKFPVRFSSNSVVSKINFSSLGKIIDFLSRGRIRQILISNLAPEGRGRKNYRRLAVRLKDFKKSIPGLIKTVEKENIIIRFFGFPACVLGGSACRSNDFCWDSRLNIEQAGDKKLYLKSEQCVAPTRNRIKTAKCEDCLYAGICGGIFREYYERFGDGELEPYRA